MPIGKTVSSHVVTWQIDERCQSKEVSACLLISWRWWYQALSIYSESWVVRNRTALIWPPLLGKSQSGLLLLCNQPTRKGSSITVAYKYILSVVVILMVREGGRSFGLDWALPSLALEPIDDDVLWKESSRLNWHRKSIVSLICMNPSYLGAHAWKRSILVWSTWIHQLAWCYGCK